MPLNDPVPSSAGDVLVNNAEVIDKVVCSAPGTEITNRVGNRVPALSDIKSQRVIGNFADGFTLPISGGFGKYIDMSDNISYYDYNKTIPVGGVIVPPGFDPISSPDWEEVFYNEGYPVKTISDLVNTSVSGSEVGKVVYLFDRNCRFILKTGDAPEAGNYLYIQSSTPMFHWEHNEGIISTENAGSLPSPYDSSNEFMACVSYSKSVGKPITIPHGAVTLSSTIELSGETRGFSINGAGEWDTIILWEGGSEPVFRMGDDPVANFADHIEIGNMQIRNNGTATSAIEVARSTFQCYINNIRISNNTTSYSESAITLQNIDSAGVDGYPIRTTINNCYLDLAGGGPAPRGIWVKSGIQVVVSGTHIQDARIPVQLGIDSTENPGEYFRNISSFYFINNSRIQFGDRGGIGDDAIGIWIPNNPVEGGGLGSITDVRLDNFQMYTSNNASSTPNQIGLKCDGVVKGLSIKNGIIDGGLRSDYGIHLNNSLIEGNIENVVSSRLLQRLVLVSGSPSVNIQGITANSMPLPDDFVSTATTSHNVYSIPDFDTLGGNDNVRFSRTTGGVKSQLGKITNSGSALSVESNAGLRLEADFDGSGGTSPTTRVEFASGGNLLGAVDAMGNMELFNNGEGLYLHSPSGNRFKVTVTDGGSLSVSPT